MNKEISAFFGFLIVLIGTVALIMSIFGIKPEPPKPREKIFTYENVEKVGEYWYCRIYLISSLYHRDKELVMLCKILSVKPIIVDAHYNNVEIQRENCLSKWEPNWFQKLLGYK